MDYITVPNIRLGPGFAYPETVNIEHIVSLSKGRIDLVNGQYIHVPENIYKEIREYLIKKGNTIMKLGD